MAAKSGIEAMIPNLVSGSSPNFYHALNIRVGFLSLSLWVVEQVESIIATVE